MNIEYSIRRSKRSRRVRIAVRGDGIVVVSAPPGTGESRIAAMVQSHAGWIARAVEKCRRMTDGVIVEKETFDLWEFAAAAEDAVRERHARIAAPLNIRLGRVSVRNMRSRWGSCSGQGNISINMLLGHLPDRLLEYVAVHEVCHLVHHDHSRRFWSLVATHLPDHRARKLELRRYGHLLYSSARLAARSAM